MRRTARIFCSKHSRFLFYFHAEANDWSVKMISREVRSLRQKPFCKTSEAGVVKAKNIRFLLPKHRKG